MADVTRLNDRRPPAFVIQLEVWPGDDGSEAGCLVIHDGVIPSSGEVAHVLAHASESVKADPERVQRLEADLSERR